MKKLHYLLLSVLFLVLFPGMASAVTPLPVPQAAPEPTSLLLIIAGIFGIFGFRRILKK
jgi:hypothetical protein